MNESLLDFMSNEAWFDIKMVKSSDNRTTEITYKAQYDSVVIKAFETCNISSLKKTHVGRGCGVRHAEAGGASSDALRRHGGWNKQSLETAYLTSLPMESIRAVNGFPVQRGRFWLRRATVEPPESLQKKIFPWVDEALKKVSTGYQNPKDSGRRSVSGFPKTICGQGFLLLMVQLRCILLQDAVELHKAFPDHPMFSFSLFRDPEYLAFEAELNMAIETGKSPYELRFREVATDIADAIITLANYGIDELVKAHKKLAKGQQETMKRQDETLATHYETNNVSCIIGHYLYVDII